MKHFLVITFLIAFLFLLVSCDTAASSYPASRVYLEGGTDTPIPTDSPPPGFYYCKGQCTHDDKPIIDGLRPMDEPTPYPTPTPYIQKYVFWRTQRVNINGLVLEFTGVIKYPYKGENYYVMYFKIWNHTKEPIVVVYPLFGKIREIGRGGGQIIGNWTAGENGQEFVRYWMINKIKLPYWHDFSSPEDVTIPPTTKNKPIIMPVVIQAPAGDVQRFLLQTDPLSNDPENFIIFYNDLPPMRCDGARAATPAGMGEPECKYHAEIYPLHYWRIQEPQSVSYYIEESGVGGSSYNYYRTAPMDDTAPISARFTEMVTYQGPSTNIMPTTNFRISQNYGCTGYSYAKNKGDARKGDCAYSIFLETCEWPGTPMCSKKGTRPKQMGWSFHMGIDMAGIEGQYLYAVVDGTVISSNSNGEWNLGYGNLTIITDGEYCFYYAHQSAVLEGLGSGSEVKSGDGIGKMGNTGASSGPHLHFEMRPYVNGGCAAGGSLSSYVNAQGFLGLMP